MAAKDIVVIGASAGGVEALIHLTRLLPMRLPAAVFIVVHFPPNSPSLLPQILNRYSRLLARHPENGQAVEPGYIYISQPDHHMLLEQGRIRLSRGPSEHGFRPAIDPLFRSAAATYGKRVVGVILTGTLGDGAAGLQVIKAYGGTALVQDPEEAPFPSMPLKAIDQVQVDEVLPIDALARRITELVTQVPAAEGDASMTDPFMPDDEVVKTEMRKFEQGQKGETHSVLTCPDCGGTLWEIGGDKTLRYRCHVGHAYSLESMLAEQGLALENALWVAVRMLEERAALTRRMASQFGGDNARMQAQFTKTADEAEANAAIIRQLLTQGNVSRVHLPGPGEAAERGDLDARM